MLKIAFVKLLEAVRPTAMRMMPTSLAEFMVVPFFDDALTSTDQERRRRSAGSDDAPIERDDQFGSRYCAAVMNWPKVSHQTMTLV